MSEKAKVYLKKSLRDEIESFGFLKDSTELANEAFTVIDWNSTVQMHKGIRSLAYSFLKSKKLA